MGKMTLSERDEFMKRMQIKLYCVQNKTLTPEEASHDAMTDWSFCKSAKFGFYLEGKIATALIKIEAGGKEYTFRLINQNPDKRMKNDKRRYSKYAKLAREGHWITWVINPTTHKYYACIEHGVFRLVNQRVKTASASA